MEDVTRVLLIGALLAAVFWVYSIVDCAIQPPTKHRGVSKPVWILIVVIFPVLGGILWFVIGRARASQMVAPRAPDDDPEFLGRIGSISDQDERIRRLEEELAQLDAEADDPRWSTPITPVTPPAEPPAASPPTRGTEPAVERPTDRPGDGEDDPRGHRGAIS
ncbi:PLD nuclease N-terminal domain-containing protein [Microbacterium sp.]|uniref:PLD nuclease N-terminal domain-containing protein n=1 Tax=Microbacterium sp. TaxID=51671 RepID=UPI0039C95B15